MSLALDLKEEKTQRILFAETLEYTDIVDMKTKDVPSIMTKSVLSPIQAPWKTGWCSPCCLGNILKLMHYFHSRRLNVDSPSFKPLSTVAPNGARGTTISPKAANAAPFTPKQNTPSPSHPNTTRPLISISSRPRMSHQQSATSLHRESSINLLRRN